MTSRRSNRSLRGAQRMAQQRLHPELPSSPARSVNGEAVDEDRQEGTSWKSRTAAVFDRYALTYVDILYYPRRARQMRHVRMLIDVEPLDALAGYPSSCSSLATSCSFAPCRLLTHAMALHPCYGGASCWSWVLDTFYSPRSSSWSSSWV